MLDVVNVKMGMSREGVLIPSISLRFGECGPIFGCTCYFITLLLYVCRLSNYDLVLLTSLVSNK